MTKLSLVVRGVALALALTGVASAEDRGPEINPYECLGRYEAATGNRSMTQVRAELEKRLHPLFEGDEPHTVKAMKLCVVAMLESRLGDDHAAEHYAGAVAEDPDEPGYELWYGRLYANFRGARGIVVEKAEDHFYKALAKIEALKKAGKFRDYHAVVEEWVHKGLLVSYQEDGMPLLPWKAYPQRGESGHNALGASLSAQFSISKDTRDFFRNNEMRLFTGELMFANGRSRAANNQLNATQIYDIARAPLRYRHEERLRLRHNLVGAFDFSYAYEKAVKGQILSYYQPPPVGPLTDTNVEEMGLGYERVFPLYPLFDFKLAGGVKRIDRQGVIEFQQFDHEKFWLYEARPSFSRFLGPDKITLDLVYVFMNVTDSPYGPKSEAQRSKYIRAANLEYALYRPLVLPEIRGGALGAHRTPTRGWYFNAGAADDDDVYGLKTVRRHDFYLGSRFEGAGNYDFTLQGTYSTSKLTELNPVTGAVGEGVEPLKSTSFRTTAIIQRRIINPDAIPGINGSVLAPDMLNLVVPITWDKGLSGSTCQIPAVGTNPPGVFPNRYTSADDCYKTYENVRVGAEIWAKFFGTGFWGPAFLTTIGYDYQYFYNIKKAFHEVHLNLRMGWGKL